MPISSILVNFLILWGIGTLLQGKPKVGTATRYILLVSCAVSFAWLIFSSTFYLFHPIFYDHAEINIASVAAYWRWGHEIYTSLDDPHRYSLLYGPLPYLIVAFFQGLSEHTILISKIPGWIFLLTSFSCVWLFARSVNKSNIKAFWILGSVAIMLCGFYNYSYWLRPDSLLITLSLLGLIAVKKIKNSWILWGVLGILAGLSSGGKLHGAFYFLPIFAYASETTDSRHIMLKLTLGGSLSVLALLAPFAIPGVDLGFYLDWISMASRHGLVADIFIKNITFIAAFWLFAYLMNVHTKYRISFYAFLISGLIVSLVGSKIGAGTNHLIPFLAVIILISYDALGASAGLNQRRILIVMGAFLLTLSINGWNRQKRIVELQNEYPQRVQEFEDLKSIFAQTDGKFELGYSSMETYQVASYKPWLIIRNGFLTVDGSALMDMGVAGISFPEATVKVLDSCSVDKFLIPLHGATWSLESLYEGLMVFPKDLNRQFESRYRIINTTQHFRLYECIK